MAIALLRSQHLHVVGVISAIESPKRIPSTRIPGCAFPGRGVSTLARAASPGDDEAQLEAPASLEEKPVKPQRFEADGGYILKLMASCFSAACVIKYGSLVFPGVTRPSIAQALAMILAPVLAAVATLVLASNTRKA